MPFLRALLSSNVQLSSLDVLEFAAAMNIRAAAEEYACVVVECTEQINSAPRLLHCVHSMPQYCRQYFEKQAINVYIEDNGTLTVALIIGQLSRGTMEKLMDGLYSGLARHGFANVVIGVGKSITDLRDFKQSYRTAIGALHYHGAFAGQKVIYSDDLSLMFQQTTLEGTKDNEKILTAFFSNDTEGLKKLLAEKAESIRMMTRIDPDTPHPTSIRRTMVEIVMTIMHAASDSGVDVEQEMGFISPYQYIFELKSTPEIIDWVMQICAKLMKAMSEQHHQMDRKTIRNVKAYIQQHLDDPDLSLDMASTHIGLSASYFSAFFIREVGVGFREYVNSLRIETAKKYLDNSEMTVSDISRRCGFRSESYFITVFKKYADMPPGAYREMKK